MDEITNYFCDENERVNLRKKEYSPSGRFGLLIRNYSTKKGCWNYSRGTLFRESDGQQVADIKRNYSAFHHSWVEKDGQEYLISGRSYMNQCIVNADAGCEFEMSDESLVKKGCAFCWATAKLSTDEKTLLVDGCYWGAPYEYRFFDFSNPMTGWPELPIVSARNYEQGGECLKEHEFILADDGKDPLFIEDGTVTLYSTSNIYKPTGQREEEISMEQIEVFGSAYDKESNWDMEEEVIYTLRRRGGFMVIEKIWKSDWQLEKEREQEEWRKKDAAQKKEWAETSTLLTSLTEILKDDTDLLLGDLWWRGSSQKDRENGEKNVWFFYHQIKAKVEDSKRSASLEWGTLEGEVWAVLWTCGKGEEKKRFDRSPEGLCKAIKIVREHLVESHE